MIALFCSAVTGHAWSGNTPPYFPDHVAVVEIAFAGPGAGLAARTRTHGGIEEETGIPASHSKCAHFALLVLGLNHASVHDAVDVLGHLAFVGSEHDEHRLMVAHRRADRNHGAGMLLLCLGGDVGER